MNTQHHHIQVLAELHWDVERPELKFSTLQQNLDYCFNIVRERDNFVECVAYEFDMPTSELENTLAIALVNKTNNLVNQNSDHWVDIKNIFVDGTPADWLLHKNTVFKHSMSQEWVNNMTSQGFDIQPEYSPGTELRLNGTCYFKFTHPFLIQRVTADWRAANDKI